MDVDMDVGVDVGMWMQVEAVVVVRDGCRDAMMFEFDKMGEADMDVYDEEVGVVDVSDYIEKDAVVVVVVVVVVVMVVAVVVIAVVVVVGGEHLDSAVMDFAKPTFFVGDEGLSQKTLSLPAHQNVDDDDIDAPSPPP
jgi:hypothetical protein